MSETGDEGRAEEAFREAGGKVDRFTIMFDRGAKDSTLEYVDWLDRVEALLVSGSCVTDAWLDHLVRHPELREMSLVNTSTTDAGLAHLKNLHRLQSLDLNVTMVTSDASKCCARQSPE